MPQQEKSENDRRKRSSRYPKFEFYYVEQVGSRHYFRFTPFGLISVIVTVLLLFAYIIVVAWYESNKQANSNISTPAASPYKQSETVASPRVSPTASKNRNR